MSLNNTRKAGDIVVDKNLIKSELVKRGLKYEDLANYLKIAVSTLGNKMNHRTSFSVDELLKISIFFNKDVSFFLK